MIQQLTPLITDYVIVYFNIRINMFPEEGNNSIYIEFKMFKAILVYIYIL